MSADSKLVAFVQPYVPAYRRGLFEAIKKRLEEEGFAFEVWHAEPEGRAAARRNSITGPWSRRITQRRLTVRGRNFTFRPILRRARTAHVVVAGLASTNLETYLLAADPRVNLMLWGQGKNFTASNLSIDSKLEAWLCKKATHVFAYTAEGRDHLLATGLPESKVSTVRNTTDTADLRRAQETATQVQIADYQLKFDLADKKVALFVGAFDAPKRLPFLFEAVDLIAQRVPNFRLLLAGAGPLDAYVSGQCESRPYVTMIGSLTASELGVLSNVVDIILMPGRVGLVAVDSLALGVPLATTHYEFHAPEAGYLDNSNSLWTADDPKIFAAEVGALILDSDRLAALGTEAKREGTKFSMERSAQIFVEGILGTRSEG
jgi:glycosyltransferase involved in cell wall biosynthesis